MDESILKRFIKVHAVTNTPGNEARLLYQSADAIVGFGEAAAEYAKIGAATRIDFNHDTCIYVTESLDDITTMLSTISLHP